MLLSLLSFLSAALILFYLYDRRGLFTKRRNQYRLPENLFVIAVTLLFALSLALLFYVSIKTAYHEKALLTQIKNELAMVNSSEQSSLCASKKVFYEREMCFATLMMSQYKSNKLTSYTCNSLNLTTNRATCSALLGVESRRINTTMCGSLNDNELEKLCSAARTADSSACSGLLPELRSRCYQAIKMS